MTTVVDSTSTLGAKTFRRTADVNSPARDREAKQMADAQDNTPTDNTPTPKDVAQSAQSADSKSIDWKAESRKWEDRAKANKTAADSYTQLKAKFDSLSKSKDDAATQLAEAKKTIADLESASKLAALRSKVSKATGVPVELFDYLQGNDEDSLTKEAKALAKWRSESTKPTAPDVKSDGNIPHGHVKENGWAEVGQFLAKHATA